MRKWEVEAVGYHRPIRTLAPLGTFAPANTWGCPEADLIKVGVPYSIGIAAYSVIVAPTSGKSIILLRNGERVASSMAVSRCQSSAVHKRGTQCVDG